MSALYLNEREVVSVLDMPLAISAVEEVMTAHGGGEVIDFPRQRVRVPDSMLHLLQGGVPALGVSGFKTYTSTPAGSRFWVHLFNMISGEAIAVLEASRLGMMRTGAASAVASRLLARQDARIAGLIGCGLQAEGQLLGLCAVLPLEQVRVYCRNQQRLRDFCERMSKMTSCALQAVDSVEAAVRNADIITTATTSPKPLFEVDCLSPGMHINAVGSNSLARRELAEKVVSRAEVICVDGREIALREAGDLLPLLEKGRSQAARWVELGELLYGARQGRTAPEQISLFESQGMAIQDIALAVSVLERAQKLKLGSALPF